MCKTLGEVPIIVPLFMLAEYTNKYVLRMTPVSQEHSMGETEMLKTLCIPDQESVNH